MISGLLAGTGGWNSFRRPQVAAFVSTLSLTLCLQACERAELPGSACSGEKIQHAREVYSTDGPRQALPLYQDLLTSCRHAGDRHREAALLQWLLGLVFGVFLLGLEAWAVALALRGPEALGTWVVPAPVAALGWLGIAAGTALVLVAQHQMGASWRIGIDDRPTRLVVHGLFRHLRNPIFSGILLVTLGIVLVAPSPVLVACWLAAFVLLRVQIGLEERHLLALHGDDYAAWAARTGRLVPGIGKLAFRGRPS